jgi:hypothetical protein
MVKGLTSQPHNITVGRSISTKMSGTTKINIIEANEYHKKPYQFRMKFANHRVASIPIRRNR